MEDDVGHGYDDCGSVSTQDISVAEIAHCVGELGQKRKGKAKGKRIRSLAEAAKARAKPKAASGCYRDIEACAGAGASTRTGASRARQRWVHTSQYHFKALKNTCIIGMKAH
jgi:hypothetical protein